MGDRIISLKEYDGCSKFTNGFATVWNVNPNDFYDLTKKTIDTMGNIITPKYKEENDSYINSLTKFMDDFEQNSEL